MALYLDLSSERVVTMKGEGEGEEEELFARAVMLKQTASVQSVPYKASLPR